MPSRKTPDRRAQRFCSRSLIVALLATLPPAAKAADAQGNYLVRGIGTEPCAAFLSGLAAKESSPRQISWLMGFASAHNKLDAQTFDIIPTSDGLDFVKVVGLMCKADGKQTLDMAANRAVEALKPMRLAVQTLPVTLNFQGGSAVIRSGALQMLQIALTQKKAYRGPIGGNPTPEFYKSLKDFQTKEGIAATGLPDIDTFVRAVLKK